MADPDAVAVVVVAAGRGRRLGGAADAAGKALTEVGGRTLLEHTLTTFGRLASVSEVVVVHTPGEAERFRRVAGSQVILTPGGATRADSVRAGLSGLTTPHGLVAIHDAARAFVPGEVVGRTIAAVTGEVIAAAPGMPVVDTVREVSGDGRVLRTLDRAPLRTVQTPQVIRADVVAVIRDRPELWDGVTDDLSVVLAAIARGDVSGQVALVDGDRRALKITHPEDLVIATALSTGSVDV